MDDDRPPLIPPVVGFDAGTYGRGFADVYDDWYPPDPSTAAAVRNLMALMRRSDRSDRSQAPRRLLELGVGTGRLALPLARAGISVTGLDSSTEMLDRLRAKDPQGRIASVLGDVAEPADWPEGPFDVVLAACNLICNLADADEQRRCVATAADRLAPGGHLVVEAFVPAPLQTGRHLEVAEFRLDAVVMIATEADPGTGVVSGRHIELRDHQPVRVRPWRIRGATAGEIDSWAEAAGLALFGRFADWEDAPYDPDGSTQVSSYRRPGG